MYRQREAIARYAKAAGFELVTEYRDEGVSGTKDLDDREGLSDLLRAFAATACAWCWSREPTAWRETFSWARSC